MKNLLLFFLFIGVISTSCNNDIQLNADYKEIMVVYGLLDKMDSVHYIRIQRAFQNTNASALSISQKVDSLYFDTLNVKVTDLTTSQVYLLKKEVSTIKDSGYFQNKVNVLYRFSAPLNASHLYRLDIIDANTGSGVSGITPIVGTPTNVTSPPGDTFDLLTGKKIRAYCLSGINARAYDVFYRFKFNEFDSISGALISQRFLDYYVLRSGLTTTLQGGSAVDQTIESDDIFNFIGNSLHRVPGVYRIATNFDAYYAGAADDLNVYQDISKPSIGIVQKKPEFTNVSNGYGLYSSRNIFCKKHPVSPSTQQALLKHLATKDLGWK